MISGLSRNWLRRAQEKTDEFRAAGAYQTHTPFWSEIKAAYMAVQHNKCAYCERRLEGPPYGYIEHDIEHFRPKNGIKRWPSAEISGQLNLNYTFSLGDDFDEGYYLLAYHLLNYVAACKVCNSILKANYFPIASSRISGQDDPRTLAAEQPLLLYPLDDLDADPEEIITFDGWLAVPKHRTGPEYQRGLVLIDFFRLNKREELVRDRATLISHIYLALQAYAQATGADRERAGRVISRFQSPDAIHANCIRCFQNVYQRDATYARELYVAAVAYLDSQAGGLS